MFELSVVTLVNIIVMMIKRLFSNVADVPYRSEMISYYHIELAYVCYIFCIVYVDAANLPRPNNAKFSISSILGTAMPAIRPIVSSGSNRCEAFKSFFGLTYEQMQVKNSMNFNEELNIDLITKNGNIKYNLTDARRLNRLMQNSSNIIVLIHGFMESSDGWMVQALAPELLKQPGLRVLALDGRKVINLEYFRSSTYARFMGELLGKFLSEIVKYGQDPSKIMLIGHSLGSHIAAVAGESVSQLTGRLIGRISALDPAGPCFSSADPDGKLDKTDATYVDVIHTNGGMLGLKEPLGHKDFYPNGGRSQPGCFISTCDHSRAWELFAESVNSPKHFPARKCGNWTMFKEGLCSKNEVAFMGLKSEAGTPGVYFFTTGSSSPFGLGAAGSG